jgi:hypothetical protein
MVPERRSGLCPSEKQLLEQRSGVFHHKNTPDCVYHVMSYVKLATTCSDLKACQTWDNNWVHTDVYKLHEKEWKSCLFLSHNSAFYQYYAAIIFLRSTEQ